jgi:hypothetical protein
VFRDESTTVLVFGHTSSKRLKVKEKVRTGIVLMDKDQIQ